MKSAKKFDIVVYGATGFTGQLVAEYLAARYKNDKELRWAMAGRSLEKLKSVRDAIGAAADTPLIVADASDPASLKAMVDQTKSVLTTVGPYQLYGNDLLAARSVGASLAADAPGRRYSFREKGGCGLLARRSSPLGPSCSLRLVRFNLGGGLLVTANSLGGTSTVAAAPASAGLPSGLQLPFTADLNGTIAERDGADGGAVVTIDVSLSGGATGVVHVVLEGRGLAGGGVSLAQSAADDGPLRPARRIHRGGGRSQRPWCSSSWRCETVLATSSAWSST